MARIFRAGGAPRAVLSSSSEASDTARKELNSLLRIIAFSALSSVTTWGYAFSRSPIVHKHSTTSEYELRRKLHDPRTTHDTGNLPISAAGHRGCRSAEVRMVVEVERLPSNLDRLALFDFKGAAQGRVDVEERGI